MRSLGRPPPISWQHASTLIGKDVNMPIKLALTYGCALLLLHSVACVAVAADCACSHCACKRSQKVCRLVHEEVSVPIVCWGCKEEEFCPPGHSKEGKSHCELVCADCEKNDEVRSKPQKFVWSEWIPCGPTSLHTRRKLMKRTVTRKIPSYKWVVEDLCAECQAGLTLPTSPPVAEIPPLPAIEEGTKILLATHSEPSDGDSLLFEFDSGLSQ
jgi:hypothetical protein